MNKFCLILIINYLIASWANAQTVKPTAVFQKVLDSLQVKGSFSLYDTKRNIIYTSSSTELDKAYAPASTFKIYNSLIGLQTGVLSGKDHLYKWNGTKHWRDEWNKDHTLETAYKTSCVWYYQELARQIGTDNMRTWLKKIGYGKGTFRTLDEFWLNAEITITPRQQLQLLNRLQAKTLPFDSQHLATMEAIMLAENTPTYALYGKTGWGRGIKSMNGKEVGWWIGYVVVPSGTYCFATCLVQKEDANKAFGELRKTVAKICMQKQGVL